MLRRMRRMVCLDGLRGVLACYVMLSHTLPFAPLPAWLLWLFQHGGAGVDVFFILSGLVIVQSLASFSYRPRPFLIARVARIYPVFLVVFAFAVAVQPLASGFPLLEWLDQDSTLRYLWPTGWPNDWAIGIATHLTMTHGLFPDGMLPHLWLGFLGAAWSLSTEWQFYLLALLIGARLGLRPLAWLFLALAAASIAWQAVAPEPWQFSRAFLPNKAQYFALGIASAIMVREGARGLGSYLPVLGATLVLCIARGGVDKLLPPLVWTVCLAAQLLPADAASAARGHSREAESNGLSRQPVARRRQSNGRFVSWPRRCGRAHWSGWGPCRTASISSTSRYRRCWAWRLRSSCKAMGGCSPRSGCRGRPRCRFSSHGRCTNGSRHRPCVMAAPWRAAA